MKSYCASVGIGFINNANINGSCLSRRKLHLNRKGFSLLAKIIASHVKLKLDNYLESSDGVFINAENNSPETLNEIFKLKNLWVQNPQNVIFSYLNINFVGNKSSGSTNLVFEHIGILTVAETKLDTSFPTAQFLLPGFHKPF